MDFYSDLLAGKVDDSRILVLFQPLGTGMESDHHPLVDFFAHAEVRSGEQV